MRPKKKKALLNIKEPGLSGFNIWIPFTASPPVQLLHDTKKTEMASWLRSNLVCYQGKHGLNIKPVGCKTLHSVQLSSDAQSCPTLCDPMNRSMPGLTVHHELLESTQTCPSSL